VKSVKKRGPSPEPGASLVTEHRNVQAGMRLPDVMRLGGWSDLASVQRHMSLLNHDQLSAAVKAAWAQIAPISFRRVFAFPQVADPRPPSSSQSENHGRILQVEERA